MSRGSYMYVELVPVEFEL